MNREIKFRAWDKSCNKMRGENGIKDCFSLRSDGVYNDDYILMQFTGIIDKNEKEVYEGDIVIHDSEKIVVSYGIQSVDAFEGAGFNLWSFYGEKLGGFRLQSEIEIIGNIFENPELLKTTKDEK